MSGAEPGDLPLLREAADDDVTIVERAAATSRTRRGVQPADGRWVFLLSFA